MKKPVRPSVYKKKSATPPANALKGQATPASSTGPAAAEPAAATPVATPAAPIVSASAPASLIRVAENRSFTIWTRHLTAPGLGGAPAPAASGSPLVRLPGRQFTIWTKPDHVRPVPMRNVPSETPVAAEPVTAAAASVPPSVPAKAEPCCRPWPLAAAALFMAGLLGFVWFKTNDANRHAETANSELAEIRAQADRINGDYEQAKQRLEAASRDLQTKLDAATAENTRLTQEIAGLREQNQKTTAELTAKSEAAAREAGEVRDLNAALAEEAAQAKRLASGQEVQFRETISRLEAEKAAAVKAAADANTELNTLKAAPR